MKHFLAMLSFVIDNYTDRVGRVVSWLTTILMLLISIDVIMRYLFSITETWIIELEWHLFAILFLVGASYALLYDKHVRVDLFYENFTLSRKRLINAMGIIFFLLPWAWVVISHGFDYFYMSYRWGEGSPQPTGLPSRWIMKLMIVVGFVLLLIQGLSQLIRATVIGRK